MGISEWLHTLNEFIILVHFESCSPRNKIFIIIQSQLDKLNFKKILCICTCPSAALIESRVQACRLLVHHPAVMVNYLSSLAVCTARVIQSLVFQTISPQWYVLLKIRQDFQVGSQSVALFTMKNILKWKNKKNGKNKYLESIH